MQADGDRYADWCVAWAACFVCAVCLLCWLCGRRAVALLCAHAWPKARRKVGLEPIHHRHTHCMPEASVGHATSGTAAELQPGAQHTNGLGSASGCLITLHISSSIPTGADTQASAHAGPLVAARRVGFWHQTFPAPDTLQDSTAADYIWGSRTTFSSSKEVTHM